MVGNILAVGLMSLGMGMSGIKDEPQMYAQDESTYTITYTTNDFEEKASDIADFLKESGYTSTSTKLEITGYMTMSGVQDQLSNIRTNASGDAIYITSVNSNLSYVISTSTWNTFNEVPPPTEIAITSQTYYEGLAEPEPNMGSDIVGTIASGLGLIGALATEFLAGFVALFYSAGALTPFAIFSLVMLGVAVSFAIVKLVLALIRSNTGA